MKGRKRSRSLRLDTVHMIKLNDLGINVSELIREMISQFLDSRDCPVCGSHLSAKRELKKEK